MAEKAEPTGLGSMLESVQRSSVLVTGINAWSFTDESTGELKEGITVQYAMPAADKGSRRGWVSGKCAVLQDEAGRFKSLPGVYSAIPEMTSKALKFSDFRFERGLVLQ